MAFGCVWFVQCVAWLLFNYGVCGGFLGGPGDFWSSHDVNVNLTMQKRCMFIFARCWADQFLSSQGSV